MGSGGLLTLELLGSSENESAELGVALRSDHMARRHKGCRTHLRRIFRFIDAPPCLLLSLTRYRRTAADWETAAKGLEGQLGEAQQAQNSSSDALAAALVRSAELEGQLQEARQARNSAAEALAAALARSQELEAKLGSLQRARGQELQVWLGWGSLQPLLACASRSCAGALRASHG